MIPNVMLSGVGRSGTTWLAELLNGTGHYRYVFEPFHPNNQVFSTYSYMRYIHPSSGTEEELRDARWMFYGAYENHWTDMYWSRTSPDIPRLVKGIRSNLLLPWMIEKFPEIRFILMLRHPVAVAASQVKLNWERNDPQTLYLYQKDLVQDHTLPFKEVIQDVFMSQNPFKEYVLHWCIANYVPLKMLNSVSNVQVVFYEDLVNRPKYVLGQLWDYLEIPGYPDSLPGDAELNRMSAQSRPDSTRTAYRSWINDVSAEVMDWTMQTIQKFGLDNFYGRLPLPILKGVHPLEVLK